MGLSDLAFADLPAKLDRPKKVQFRLAIDIGIDAGQLNSDDTGYACAGCTSGITTGLVAIGSMITMLTIMCIAYV